MKFNLHRLRFEPKKCPHCGEWLVSPEQVKQERKQFRRFIITWTAVLMIIIFGLILGFLGGTML